MPTSTIPFDPSLVLGMIVDPQRIAKLEKIATEQAPVDAARDYVNALLRQKLSLDMTARELISLGATDEQLGEFTDAQTELMDTLIQATGDLAKAVIAAEKAIAEDKSDGSQQQIGSQLQSPVDFAASQLQSMPLSSDSMDMDVQYFRYEENQQQSDSSANAISSFVGAKVTGFLGSSFGASTAVTAKNSINNTRENHNIIGTLVICANCTSKDVQIFSPLKLDVEAATDSYNMTASDKLPVEDPTEMKKVALAESSDDDKKNSLPILVGASYGSSFVGFVHFEKIEKTASSQSARAASVQARAEVETNLFLEGIQGSFGLDAQSASSVKDLLSTSNIQSHCSVITMGLIPSIKSSQVTAVVKELQGDPKSYMDELAKMQASSDDSNASMAAGASAAKKGQSIEKMKSDYISAAVDSVGKIDEASNQVIDLNSLQIALDDYVQKAGEGKIGVPINFYIKYVTKKDIAREWMTKYYPDMLHEKENSAPAA